MLRELAELGMALARAAAQQALQDGNRPAADATPPQAPGASDGPGGSGRPSPDPGLVFARLSRAVRQTIALEARIAAGDFAVARRPRPDRLAADPRQDDDPRLSDEPGLSDDSRLPTVRRVVHAAADAETDRGASNAVHRDIDERLEDLTDIDPDGALSVDELMQAICDDLGIRLDLSRLPDEVLEPSQPASQRDAARSRARRSDAGGSYLRRESPPKLRRSGPDPP